jgi:hypothetical protein
MRAAPPCRVSTAGNEHAGVISWEGTPLYEGEPGRWAMYFTTVIRETRTPSIASSPWIQRASQSLFSQLIRRISVGVSAFASMDLDREKNKRFQCGRIIGKYMWLQSDLVCCLLLVYHFMLSFLQVSRQLRVPASRARPLVSAHHSRRGARRVRAPDRHDIHCRVQGIPHRSTRHVRALGKPSPY